MVLLSESEFNRELIKILTSLLIEKCKNNPNVKIINPTLECYKHKMSKIEIEQELIKNYLRNI